MRVHPPKIILGYWVIIVPVIGGLLIGLMARYGSEKIRGHGIPEALEAILIDRSKMSPKVAILKPISSAISIGTGGPFGAEGPIVMTGGAFGSLFAQFFISRPPSAKHYLSRARRVAWQIFLLRPSRRFYLASKSCCLTQTALAHSRCRFGICRRVVARIIFGNGPIFTVVPHLVPDGLTLTFALSRRRDCGIGRGGLDSTRLLL